jgi:5-methylcytosine-specific restriction endonuclease McrA
MENKKICRKCNIEKTNESFYKTSKNRDGLSSWCKPCQQEYNKKYDKPEYHKQWIENNKEKNKKIHEEYYLKNKDKMNQQSREYSKSPRGRYLSYLNGARSRNLEFNLTEDEFLSFWQHKCSYCGDPIETIGLDRIDSKKPYSLDNCVPCCYTCNKIKMDMLVEDFLNHIKKIYNEISRNSR